MKKTSLLLLMLVLFSSMAFAGGQQEAAKTTDLKSMSWDEIVAQAKTEGSVTWFQWYLQPAFREAVKSFEAEYGITVTIPDGTLDANKNKLLAEKKRSTGDIDVISLGGDTITTFDPAEYFYGPIVDIIPGGEKLRTKIMGGDGKGYAVAFWGNQSGLAYDPTRVDEAMLPQTIEELSDWMAANPKGLGFNMENGGSGPSFIQSIVRETVDDVDFSSGESSAEKISKLAPAWEWLNAREDQFVITASNSDSLTRLNDGEFIIVPAWEDHLAGLQNKNEIDKRIKFYIPEFGMNGGGNVVGIPANAPHKAAALVFVAWLTSADTQAELNKVFGAAPQHPDASSEYALVPMSQRAFSTDFIKKPFSDDIQNAFIEEVILK